MKREMIAISDFRTDIFDLWGKQWLLLTAGDLSSNDLNCMTVAWGSIGIMWNKPFVQTVVRPTRHTDIFMRKYDTFTLTAFSAEYIETLKYLGSVSGRDEDKIKTSGLTLIPSQKISCPAFGEAELIIECRKIYTSEFKPEQFGDPSIEMCYPDKDYHNVYFGEILSIEGTERFRK